MIPSEPGLWIAVAAILPLLAVTATAFAKLAVVLGILRGALGIPGVLPASVMTGLAAVLAALAMAPLGRRVAEAVGPMPYDASGWLVATQRAWPPLSEFLTRHTRPDEVALIAELAGDLDPGRAVDPKAPELAVPAFMLSELGAAFQFGVVLLIPFLIVDLLVANTLAVLGFALLSPALIALPFKLLLFLAADGWGLLARALLGGYA